jgi:comEA protein
MPLSEALAARHHANRPWWRRAAQHIDDRIPPTLHGRWALSLPAATAVALVAVAGAAAGGWYLTRAQSTVVDVARVGGGGGNAGEATVSTTPPPDDDHVPPNAVANADGACRTRSWPPGTPRTSASGAPAAWRGQLLRIVLVGAEPASTPMSRLRGEDADTQAAPPDRYSTGLALRVATDAVTWDANDTAGRAASAMSLVVGQTTNGLAARTAWTASVPAQRIFDGPAAESAMAAGRSLRGPVGRHVSALRVPTGQTSNGLVLRSAMTANLTGRTSFGLPARRAAIPSVQADRIAGAQARVLIVRSSVRLPPPAAMDRWLHAPITHRFARAMAARRQGCAPRTAMATSPAVAGVASVGAVVVDVEGRVAHPGIQMLPGGSRVFEALAAAGGALPGVDVTALDLARPVTDGEQLRVGIAGAPSPVVGLPQPSAGGAARGKRGKPAQPVNLNTATLEQLETVPDVGPALAQRIMDWRSEHGRFESVAQLRQVRGIGERKFADMRDSVTV